MHCPRLSDLPPPPTGKTGWPWTQETLPLPATRSDGTPWPRISIVTPSYNQGQYIEETIRSVLLQGYPDLEYMVMDGGSSDCTREILAKYSRWFSYWRSHPDKGQSCAINHGMAQCTGAWRNWLNSDDCLASGAVQKVAVLGLLRPDADLICGSRLVVREGRPGWSVDPVWQTAWRDYQIGSGVFPQECTFYSARVADRAGPLIEESHFKFDIIHFVKALRNARRVVLTNEIFGLLRAHPEQKTRSKYRSISNEQRVLDELNKSQILLDRAIARASRTRFRMIVLDLIRLWRGKSQRVLESIDFDWTTGETKSTLLSDPRFHTTPIVQPLFLESL